MVQLLTLKRQKMVQKITLRCIYIYIHTYMYMYICIYAGCGFIIWAKFGPFEGCHLGQVCFFLYLLIRNTIKIKGFNILKTAQEVEGLLSGPSWPLFGPDNDSYLD